VIQIRYISADFVSLTKDLKNIEDIEEGINTLVAVLLYKYGNSSGYQYRDILAGCRRKIECA